MVPTRPNTLLLLLLVVKLLLRPPRATSRGFLMGRRCCCCCTLPKLSEFLFLLGFLFGTRRRCCVALALVEKRLRTWPFGTKGEPGADDVSRTPFPLQSLPNFRNMFQFVTLDCCCWTWKFFMLRMIVFRLNGGG